MIGEIQYITNFIPTNYIIWIQPHTRLYSSFVNNLILYNTIDHLEWEKTPNVIC